MSLKSLERAARLALVDASLGLEGQSVEEQRRVYERLKEKYPGREGRQMRKDLRQSMKDDHLLGEFLRTWKPE